MGGNGKWATAIGQYRSGFLLEEVFFWHGVGWDGGGSKPASWFVTPRVP